MNRGKVGVFSDGVEMNDLEVYRNELGKIYPWHIEYIRMGLNAKETGKELGTKGSIFLDCHHIFG